NLLHYVSVLLPFFALMLANWLPARLRHPVCHHWLWRVQYVVLALVLNTALVLNGWMFPLRDWALAVLALALLALGIWGIPRWSGGPRLVIVSVSVSAVFWMLTNLNLYPRLLEYQAGTELGNVLMERHAGTENIHCLEGDVWAASFDVAIRRRAKPISLDALSGRDRPTVLFVTAEGRERIEEKGLLFDVLGQSSNYDFSRIGWAFLNPNTRKDELRAAYLLQVRPR
ncbi:MAG: hypothetical protein LBV29_02470, partial [Azoarcus sp.]|nr:hypothetical protein [Azoarcus sp.]